MLVEGDIVLLALRNLLAVEATTYDGQRLAAAKAATANLVRAHGISEFTVYRVRKEMLNKYRNNDSSQ